MPSYTAVFTAVVNGNLSNVLNWFQANGVTPLGRLPNLTPDADLCDLQAPATSGTLTASGVDSSTGTASLTACTVNVANFDLGDANGIVVDSSTITATVACVIDDGVGANTASTTFTSPSITFTANASVTGTSHTQRIIFNGYSGQMNTGLCPTFGSWVSTLGLNISSAATVVDAIGLRVVGNLTMAGSDLVGSAAANAFANVTGNLVYTSAGSSAFGPYVKVQGTSSINPAGGFVTVSLTGCVFTGLVTVPASAFNFTVGDGTTMPGGMKITQDAMTFYSTAAITIPVAGRVYPNVVGVNTQYGLADSLITGTLRASNIGTAAGTTNLATTNLKNADVVDNVTGTFTGSGGTTTTQFIIIPD